MLISKFKTSTLILVGSLIFLFSCTAFSTGLKLPDFWTSGDELISFYNSNHQQVRSMRCQGILQIESPQFNERVPLQLYYNGPDSLKLVLEGPLGIDVAHVFVDRDSYIVVLPRDEEMFAGSMRELDIQQLLYDLDVADLDMKSASAEAEDIHREITGFFQGWVTLNSDMVSEDNLSDSLRTEDVLKYSSGASDINFKFPRRSIDLRTSDVFDADGIKRVIRTFRRYSGIKGVRLSRQISYTFPQEKSRLTVRYTDVKINSHIKAEEFNIKRPDRK